MVSEAQRQVGSFVEEHGLAAPPAYRLLDVASESGKLAREVTVSTDYGTEPSALDVDGDEVGDVLFSPLAFAEAVDVDASTPLDETIARREDRLDEYGSAGSGR